METAGIIALIVGAIGAIVSNFVNSSSVSDTNQQNRQLAAQQNQWNIEQWNRQNAYNLPAQQVARLAGAGINPSLAIGQSGLVDAGSSKSLPSAAGATMQPFIMDNLGTQFTDSAIKASEIELNKKNAEKADADAKEALSRIPTHEKETLEKETQIKQYESQIELNKKALDSISAQIDNYNAQKALNEASASYTAMKEYIDWYLAPSQKKLNESQTNKLKADAQVAFETARNLSTDTNVKKATIKQIEQRIKADDAYFRSTYGDTPEKVAENINKRFDTVNKQLDALFKSAEWHSSDTYKRIQMILDIEAPILEPIRALAGATGTVMNGIGSINGVPSAGHTFSASSW